jgi:hypothetical protein
MRFLGNAVVFVILYILFMLPTYFLPYLGSNSFVLSAVGVASGAGISPAFWPHLGSLIVLVVVAWFRGALVGKNWLIIFPILAAVFDLVPGLSSIPLVPTVMHLLAIILGVVGVPATAASSREASEEEALHHPKSQRTEDIPAGIDTFVPPESKSELAPPIQLVPSTAVSEIR